MNSIVIVSTLDTKGVQVAYLRDRLNALGLSTIVVDSGIVGEPDGIVPDISNEEVALRGGVTIESVRESGTRGQAVEVMRALVTSLVVDLFAAGKVAGGISIGGVGSVMGAAAIQSLPVGVPKIVVAPTASGHHEFGPYVGTKDVMTVHSVVDIHGLNPVLTTVLDNVAAAMVGMLSNGHRLKPPPADQRYVAATMLGNTTTAVDAAAARLADFGVETVVFHSNGVGGRAMEELIQEGQFVGVLDYTTNEITDPLTGGIHDGGPNRLRVAGAVGIPQVVLPGCIDFCVWAAGTVPDRLRDRPSYSHNPEYTLVRASHDEKRIIARIFAERLNEATGPVHVILPTQGLSIPNKPDGPFWDPEGDQLFRDEVRRNLRADIPSELVDLHINDPALGRYAAEQLNALLAKEAQE